MVSIKGTMYSIILYTLLVTSLFITEGLATECYSCDYAIRHYDCLQLPTKTCVEGEVCYTEVQRRVLEGKRYYKGCMERNRCYGKMSLNDAEFCETVSNRCTYCCEGDICNAYNTATRGRLKTFTWYICALILFLRLT